LFERRLTPTTSGCAKSTSSQKAFRRKEKEALVEQSPVASTTDISSQAPGAEMTVASEVEKGGTSAAPPVEGHQDDLCVSDTLPTLSQQTTEVGGTCVEGDDDRFLYAGTPWQNDVIAVDAH
jgi:hypothetical protein